MDGKEGDLLEHDHLLKTAAIVFGIVFLAIGILGFVPQALSHDNLLFGLFRVNNIHNIVHLASGVVALLCGLNSEQASRMYFQIFGIIYALVAILGVLYHHHDLFNGMLFNNVHDEWLHTLIALVSLYLGFFFSHKDRPISHDHRTRL